jgi:hypothetical protein
VARSPDLVVARSPDRVVARSPDLVVARSPDRATLADHRSPVDLRNVCGGCDRPIRETFGPTRGTVGRPCHNTDRATTQRRLDSFEIVSKSMRE